MPFTRHNLRALSTPELTSWLQYLRDLKPGQWWCPEGDVLAEYLATRAAIIVELELRGIQLQLF